MPRARDGCQFMNLLLFQSIEDLGPLCRTSAFLTRPSMQPFEPSFDASLWTSREVNDSRADSSTRLVSCCSSPPLGQPQSLTAGSRTSGQLPWSRSAVSVSDRNTQEGIAVDSLSRPTRRQHSGGVERRPLLDACWSKGIHVGIIARCVLVCKYPAINRPDAEGKRRVRGPAPSVPVGHPSRPGIHDTPDVRPGTSASSHRSSSHASPAHGGSANIGPVGARHRAGAGRPRARPPRSWPSDTLRSALRRSRRLPSPQARPDMHAPAHRGHFLPDTNRAVQS